MGGEWMHTLNDQVFRGFFTGRYLFDSVTGFLRYASPAAPGRLRAQHGRLLERLLRDRASVVSCRYHAQWRPAALLPPGRGADRARHRRGRRIDRHQRRVLAVHPGSVAGAAQPDAALRPALGRAAHAGDRRPDDHGVRALPQRSGVPLGRDDSRSMEHVAAARRRDVGSDRRGTVGACAAAPASTSPGRTS